MVREGLSSEEEAAGNSTGKASPSPCGAEDNNKAGEGGRLDHRASWGHSEEFGFIVNATGSQ